MKHSGIFISTLGLCLFSFLIFSNTQTQASDLYLPELLDTSNSPQMLFTSTSTLEPTDPSFNEDCVPVEIGMGIDPECLGEEVVFPLTTRLSIFIIMPIPYHLELFGACKNLVLIDLLIQLPNSDSFQEVRFYIKLSSFTWDRFINGKCSPLDMLDIINDPYIDIGNYITIFASSHYVGR